MASTENNGVKFATLQLKNTQTFLHKFCQIGFFMLYLLWVLITFLFTNMKPNSRFYLNVVVTSANEQNTNFVYSNISLNSARMSLKFIYIRDSYTLLQLLIEKLRILPSNKGRIASNILQVFARHSCHAEKTFLNLGSSEWRRPNPSLCDVCRRIPSNWKKKK